MRRAVIDIGTNSVKLLVADVQDGKITPVISKGQISRLGEGVHESKRLSPAAIARTVKTISQLIADAKELGALEIIALTTSAARDAANGDEFLNAVNNQCGLEVQVISGDREAGLIFRGVSNDPAWEDKPILVMDVGGGSVEFIQGQAGRMELCQSLPLGALRLTEQFGEGRFAELRDYLRATLRPVLARHTTNDRRMIGTGGTMLTLAKIYRASVPFASSDGGPSHGRTEAQSVDHLVLSREYLNALVDQLRAMPPAERKNVPGLPPKRADIIVAGGAVFVVGMEVLDVQEITVSIRNLRYGMFTPPAAGLAPPVSSQTS